MRSRGLPQLSDSTVANASASLSMASASLSRRPARSAGVVRDQVANALSAASTAASTWALLASGTSAILAPVLALRTGCGAPSPATNLPPINISVSSMDSLLPLQGKCRLFRRSAGMLAFARQIIGGEDRQKRDDD